MTSTPGSAAPTASEVAGLVPRFGRTERLLHWVHATAFFGLLGSGLILYLPQLAAHIGNRPLIKAIHLGVAAGWLTLILMVSIAGDRQALRATRRDLERFTDDDLDWLRRRPRPQGRFNAGQKAHAVIQAALAVLFTVSGALLWLGERTTTLRLPGTIALHDVAMYVAMVLVAGHLYMALLGEQTRPALRGMVQGTVRAAWAREHHERWVPGPWPGQARVRVSALLAALAVGAVGAVLGTLLVLSVF